MPEILSTAGMLAALILVLAAAYYCTKWLGKKSMAPVSRSQNIKVMDTVTLGADRQILLVKTAGKCMLLGVTAQHIEKICDLDETQLVMEDTPENPGFSGVLKNVLKTQWGMGSGNEKNQHNG